MDVFKIENQFFEAIDGLIDVETNWSPIEKLNQTIQNIDDTNSNYDQQSEW